MNWRLPYDEEIEAILSEAVRLFRASKTQQTFSDTMQITVDEVNAAVSLPANDIDTDEKHALGGDL